jgi:division protein CdvB (Snf7/Vps24/ESCRT-III family)
MSIEKLFSEDTTLQTALSTLFYLAEKEIHTQYLQSLKRLGHQSTFINENANTVLNQISLLVIEEEVEELKVIMPEISYIFSQIFALTATLSTLEKLSSDRLYNRLKAEPVEQGESHHD